MTQTSVCLLLSLQTVDKHIVICFIYVCVFRKEGIAQIVNCLCQMLAKDLQKIFWKIGYMIKLEITYMW